MVRALRHAITVVAFVVALMSGILSLLREFLLFQYPTKFQEPPLFWGCLRVAFGVSLVALWHEERKKRLTAEELNNATPTPAAVPRVDVHVSQDNSSFLDTSPQLAMRAIQPSLDAMRGMSFEGAPFPEVEFRLRHLGGRPATSISVSKIVSLKGNFSIQFDLLSFLPIATEEVVGFEVQKIEGFVSRKSIALGGRTHLLQDFVWDSRNGNEEVHFPFTAWFMDGVDSLSKRQRLIYNFNTRKFDIIDEYPPLNFNYENLDRI